jgi:O-antigen/teichoic acid export membrane protein
MSMPRNLINTIANFFGSASTTVLTIGFTIVYFRLLGTESYGLVSFCTTILIIGDVIVNRGIGGAVTRELARREHNPELAQEMRDVLFTLQLVQISFALCCGLAIAALSRTLATEWLQRDTLGTEEAVHAIMLLGGVAVLQFPRGLCNAALAGLQWQIFGNVSTAAFTLVRGIATIAALHWIGPTATVFLAVQLVMQGAETVVIFVIAWRWMPKGERRAHIDLQHLRRVWAFAAADGMAILIGIATQQADRILLSRLLPLDMFGVYSLVVLIADSLQRGAGPFITAQFPHFTDLIARKRWRQLSRDYHRITIIIAALILPAAMLICFFSTEILQLVMANRVIGNQFVWLLEIRTLATAANILQWLPHVIQLATGLSAFVLFVNTVSASIYLPGIVFLTPIYGVLVPAVLWLAVQVIWFVPMIMVTHHRALKGEAWLWIEGSVLRPCLLAIVVVAISRYFAPSTVSWFVTVPWLVATGFVAMIAVLLASKRTRSLFAPVIRGVGQRLSQ